MGLFNFIKKQMLEVVEWTDDSKYILAHKYELNKREEIMNSSTLVVRPSQAAIFVHKGQVCDVFGPGSYKLATENIPFLTKIMSLPTGFNSPIKAEVYFVNTKQMSGLKWGTQNPIMMRDAEFGNVRIRAFGAYSFKVEDPKKFMEEIFGTTNTFTTASIVEQIRPTIIQGFTDFVAESKVSALDLAAEYNEFSKGVQQSAQEHFAAFGLKLCTLLIENISLPEELEKTLDERSKLGMLGDQMATFAQYQATLAMRDAAKNESGGNLAGLGVGLGAGTGIGQMFAQSLGSVQNAEKPAPAAKVEPKAKRKCVKCGADIRANAKFCPECGEKQPTKKHCISCGAEIKPTAKFCPECGEKQD